MAVRFCLPSHLCGIGVTVNILDFSTLEISSSNGGSNPLFRSRIRFRLYGEPDSILLQNGVGGKVQIEVNGFGTL